jgi:intracellular multiplication protein IcmV
MGFFSGVKKVAKPFVDVPRWIGYDQLKGFTGWLAGLIKRTFTIQQAAHTETFEESMVRLKLTEQDLIQRVKEFKRLMIFWLVAFIMVLGYAAYQVGMGAWGSFILSLSIAFLTLSQVFRYSFWVFQIRHRKLGCTLREWWYSKITEEKPQ